VEHIENNLLWQIAIVVEDIDKTLDNYTKIFGIEKPAIIIDEKKETVYYDKVIFVSYKMAFLKMGLIQFEIIEPDSQQSSWRDFLNKYGDGVHHIALKVNDLNNSIEYLNNLGMGIIQSADFTNGNYHYIDTKEQLGIILELAPKRVSKN